MGGEGFEPRYHPAGLDAQLRKPLEDVRAGRWKSMRDLLNSTLSHALRTSRSQVLAAAAAEGDAVEAWLQDEPCQPNAGMMLARVEVQRALAAHGAGRRDARELEARARAACTDAARRWPADPVPWIARLALAQVDTVAWEHRQRHPREPILPPGPWPLLHEAHRRDPCNREAWHRMLQALRALGEPTADFARWVSSWAPTGSALTLLPLYVYAALYQEQRSRGAAALTFWTSDPVPYYTRRGLEHWFAHADRTSWSVQDLNHLGQALCAGGFAEGAEVFRAIGECATPVPWQYSAVRPDRWREAFLAARTHYLPDPSPGAQHARPRR
ncbi:hypothetical protein ACIQVO_37470 [Streptomyces sp. NPDC101062]|uniref:hypothetical protein n=1 Tax=unclassified Streptomyces TaxID=2593676 RepID=UPI003806425D